MDVFEDPATEMSDSLKMLVYRFKCLLFGLSGKPFNLPATIEEHIRKFKDKYWETFEILDTCIYVDDLVSGKTNIENVTWG